MWDALCPLAAGLIVAIAITAIAVAGTGKRDVSPLQQLAYTAHCFAAVH